VSAAENGQASSRDTHYRQAPPPLQPLLFVLCLGPQSRALDSITRYIIPFVHVVSKVIIVAIAWNTVLAVLVVSVFVIVIIVVMAMVIVIAVNIAF
jgi:type IV secretory pathway VirB6-like protein